MVRIVVFLGLALLPPADLIAGNDCDLQAAPEVLALDRELARYWRDHADIGGSSLIYGGVRFGGPVFGNSLPNVKAMLDSIQRPPFLARLNWRPREAFVSRSNDLAYSTGPYDFSLMLDKSSRTAFSGEYVIVWSRVDREWKAIAAGPLGDWGREFVQLSVTETGVVPQVVLETDPSIAAMEGPARLRPPDAPGLAWTITEYWVDPAKTGLVVSQGPVEAFFLSIWNRTEQGWELCLSGFPMPAAHLFEGLCPQCG